MWGAQSADTEISDMAAENTGEQLSKSAKFKHKVQRVLFDHMASTEQMGTAALANPELLDALAAGLAEVAEAAKKFGVLDGDKGGGSRRTVFAVGANAPVCRPPWSRRLVDW